MRRKRCCQIPQNAGQGSGQDGQVIRRDGERPDRGRRSVAVGLNRDIQQDAAGFIVLVPESRYEVPFTGSSRR
jgi:hypothetical protein